MTSRTLALLLALCPQVGSRTVTKILLRLQLLGIGPDEFVKLSSATFEEEFGLNKRVSQSLQENLPRLTQSIASIEKQLAGHGIQYYSVADTTFPSEIEEFDGSLPAAIFAYGNIRLLKGNTFSVLSSRFAPSEHLDAIEAFAEQGVLNKEILVAGHDTPEYQRAAVVPLRWGAPRILCLDRGFFEVFGPDLKAEAFRAARLWRYEFDPQTDLAISPFRPDAKFIGINNKVRDRLVAALSQRVVFGHINPGRNMEWIAKRCLELKKPVQVFERIAESEHWRTKGATVVQP